MNDIELRPDLPDMDQKKPRKKRVQRGYNGARRKMLAEIRARAKEQEQSALKERKLQRAVHRAKMSKTEYYRAQRQALLERLIGLERKCHGCGKGPLLKSRQWIVIDGKIALCIGCARIWDARAKQGVKHAS